MNKSCELLVVCPHCKKSLKWTKEFAECLACKKKYPIEIGVVRFLENIDEFYEGNYVRQIHYIPGNNLLKNWVFFNLVQSGILGEIKKSVNPNANVLDIGCAGGIRWLGSYAQTIGIDLSLSSLIKATECYDLAIQAKIEILPFKDSSFDLIYGSYIFEHLSDKSKSEFLNEARRVLKPGGKLILQFDTLSDNWLTRFAMKDMAAFEKSFIATDGHIGLEPLPAALERFRSRGFKVLRALKFGTTFLQYQATYGWLNTAYGKDYAWIRWVSGFVNWALGKPSGIILEFAVTAFDKTINRFSSAKAATRAIVVAEKV